MVSLNIIGEELYELHGRRAVAQRISCNLYQSVRIGFPCNIRTLSDIAWKTNRAGLVQIAGYPLNNRPTAVQFIEFFSNHIQRNYMDETKDKNRLTTSLEPRTAALAAAALSVPERIRKCRSYSDRVLFGRGIMRRLRKTIN